MTLLRLATLTVLVSAALVCADPYDYWDLVPYWAAKSYDGCLPYGAHCDGRKWCCPDLSCSDGRCLQAQCSLPGQQCGWEDDACCGCCWHLGLTCTSPDSQGTCVKVR